MATVPDVSDDVHSNPGVIPMNLLSLFGDATDHDDMALLDLVRGGFMDDAPGEPLLPFADWLEVQGQVIRLKGSPTASWLAAKVDELAGWARRLEAASPADFDARWELERDARPGR
jgi:hypothetical protein